MNFADEIASWYKQHKRNLPWRHTTDAYLIWLSEIILQQTRVEQGLPYYRRFAEAYPTVADFAAASEDEILKLWQGLGYYSRGRNMLTTARQVMAEHNGRFPTSYEQLIQLKGIGEYTAAAISSFAANEAKAVVDGNVYRVLARYFGIDTPINSTEGIKIFRKLADEVLNRDQPALHNQAIMEFGAMLCKPKSPACGTCPVRQECRAFLNNAVAQLPVKLKKTKVKERFFTYFLVLDNDRILLNKRNDNDIWANMYDLPSVETMSPVLPYALIQQPEVQALFGAGNAISEVFGAQIHVLTHQRIHAKFAQLARPPIQLKQEWFFAEVESLEQYALPKIIFTFLTKFFNLKYNSLFSL